MIFSLPLALKKSATNVQHDGKSVAYSWGNSDMLNKWIQSMNNKQIESVLGIEGKTKYPLIWLVEGFKGSEVVAQYQFSNLTFWISVNSDVSKLNENRDFSIQYKVANDFINQLKLVATIGEYSITWDEKSNVTTNRGSKQTDIWDSVILTLDLRVNKNCLKKLY